MASDAASWATNVRPYEGNFVEYTARVAAKVVDSNGDEYYSDWVTATFTFPDPPTNLAISHNLIDRTIEASFDPPANFPAGLGYHYVLSDSSGELESGNVPGEGGTRLTFETSLKLGETYTVEVAARFVDDNGNEWMSHALSGTLLVPASSWSDPRRGGGDPVDAPSGLSVVQDSGFGLSPNPPKEGVRLAP